MTANTSTNVSSEDFRAHQEDSQPFLYDWVKHPLASYLIDMGRSLSPDTLQHFREHLLFGVDASSALVQQAGFEIREVVSRRGDIGTLLEASQQ